MSNYDAWRVSYQAALEELDRNHIPQRIDEANAAIDSYIESSLLDREERRRIEDARNALEMLKAAVQG
jgi:hypothetical protein